MLFTRVTSYFAGILLLVFGGISLGIDIELAQAPSSSSGHYVLDIMCIGYATLICVATLLRYGGGLWFVFGVISSGLAIHVTVSLFRMYLRDEQLRDPFTSYSRTAEVWVFAVFCLVMGHIAHRKKRKSLHSAGAEPTAP
jgi:hypothetical protein